MMIKMVLILIFTCIIPSIAWSSINIVEADITCSGSNECNGRKEKLNDLVRKYPSFNHLETLLKLYMKDESVTFFNYRVLDLGDEKFKISGNLILNKRILEINLDEFEELTDAPAILSLREDGFFDRRNLSKLIQNLENLARSKGYPDAKVRVDVTENSEGFVLVVKLQKGRANKLREVNVITSNKFLKEYCDREFYPLLNRPYDINSVKEKITNLNELFVGFGYYPIELKVKSKVQDYSTKLYVELNKSILTNLYISGNSFYETPVLKDKFKDSMTILKKNYDKEGVRNFLKDLYLDKGFYDVSIKVEEKKFEDVNGVSNITFIAKVKENNRYRLTSLNFKGNDFFSDKQLEKLFYDNTDSDVRYGLHDEKYYTSFVEILKSKYLEEGFVNILIEKPQVNFNKEDHSISIEYRIREVIRSQISSVDITGVNEDIKNQLLKLMTNLPKRYFNPLNFDEDLKKIITHLRNEGYFYAVIKSSASNDLVRYNQDNSSVRIRIEVDLDKKYKINDLIIIGNYKTRGKLIKRESGLEKGSYLTDWMIRNAQSNLLALGLFSRAAIRPVKMGDQVDLFIDIKEKDFGLLELAPGFRTDVGLKISSKLSYSNIDGMNKQVSVNAIINRRLDLDSLDERRRENDEHLLEYEVNVNYSENKIFDWPLDYSASFSTLRRRFYSFDADIQRLNNTVTKNVNNWLSFSIRQQLEVISQYDASIERENGNFQIGSMTPGVTLDFRDNRINPLKGAYFSLTYEVANPTFLSQSNEELEVNYYKVISRNRFYIPMGDVTLAISTTLGSQKNLAEDTDPTPETNGYIPNIKVFRLTGVDLVRGFDDSEINRLTSGLDISEVVVDDSAYMVNLKFEPRVFLSENTMLGIFYDAGRVFVDTYDFSQLRSSVGLTFKYLTPVGSLDFDYGIKLLRLRDSDGNLESPGRLHVSIGFF